MNPKKYTTDITASRYWAVYDTFTAEIDLLHENAYPRAIVMLSAGDLCVTRMDGSDGTISGVWQGFEFRGMAATITTSQTASVLVYW